MRYVRAHGARTAGAALVLALALAAAGAAARSPIPPRTASPAPSGAGVAVAPGAVLVRPVAHRSPHPAPALTGETPVRRGAGIGPYAAPAPEVVVASGVRGTATIASSRGIARVTVAARGLRPGSTYAADVSLGSCTDGLGPFRYDPSGPANRTNEIGLDLTAGGDGRASASVSVRAFDLDQPLSMVVRQPAGTDVVPGNAPGARVACGNLVPQGRLDLRLGPYATAAGVAAGPGVTGSAWLTTIDGATFVHLDAAGLAPGSRHAAHLDLGGCAAHAGHFRFDPAGPASRANEVWLDLVAGGDGRAAATILVRAIDLRTPLSVVIHQGGNPDFAPGSVPGASIACGQTPASAPAASGSP